MCREKFLTVMAVLDEQSQELMKRMQSQIISEVAKGTQTMGIPFHITLGSYPVNMKNEIEEAIRKISAETKRFSIELLKYNDFDGKIIYLEPTIPRELSALREQFKCDYANRFDWVPHATLFRGEEIEVKRAMKILPKIEEPIKSSVIGIELGEFFPPRKIIRTYFG